MGETVSRKEQIQKPPFVLSSWLAVGLSLCVQAPLATFLGHAYDMRIFMATGYMVASGQNPYVAQNLTHIFNNPAFQGMTSIGYPPPWALWLGVAYQISYKLIPNLFFYNLVIKLPILAANIGLAFLVAKVLKNQHVNPQAIVHARNFLLFNPFLLLASSTWGQFDSIVALLALYALIKISSGKWLSSAILLGLAIAFKPIALPLILAGLLYLKNNAPETILRFLGTCLVTVIGVSVIPFILFHWDPTLIFQHWNAHFTMEGGMSFVSVLQAFFLPKNLPPLGWLVGFLWIPALGIAFFILRRGITDFPDLIKKSTALILVFYLCRTWLSEPNVLLLVPLVLILVSVGKLKGYARVVIWLVPLAFVIFNTSLYQLLFFAAPALETALSTFSSTYYLPRLIALAITAAVWLIAGWWMVFSCMKPSVVQKVELKPAKVIRG